MKVKERSTGIIYTAYTQSIDLNRNGIYYLRYIIGHEDKFGGLDYFKEAIYSNEEFNQKYEVIEEG